MTRAIGKWNGVSYELAITNNKKLLFFKICRKHWLAFQ
jgi:hypothetical protein